MSKKDDGFFLAEECPAKTVDDGIRRAVLAHGEDLMCCRLWFDKNAVGKLHEHPHVQISYILSGKFEFQIGDKKVVLSAGDSTYKVSGIIHGSVCLEAGELLDIFTPERKDFLK